LGFKSGTLGVDANTSPPLYDRDLDLPRQPAPTLSEQDIGRAQRVVVNPMLAILGGLLGLVVIRYALRYGEPGFFWISVLVFLISGCLIQFHCLDCGATGWLSTARRHACPSVISRSADVRPAGLRLGVGAQIRVWAWFLGVVALCYLVLSLARR
jgi:hypothetical protein